MECKHCSVALGRNNWSTSMVASYSYLCNKCNATASRERRKSTGKPRGGPIARDNFPGVCYTAEEIKTIRNESYDRLFLSAVKKRATREGIKFELTHKDIAVPTHCPVLGIELERRGDRDNCPSLDRIIPELGYVKDNVVVISYRANRIKNDATLDELTKITEWLQTQIHKKNGKY